MSEKLRLIEQALANRLQNLRFIDIRLSPKPST
jgi:hypothetical protein